MAKTTVARKSTQTRSTKWQGFYSTRQVSRLARVPIRTLHDWKMRGVVAPSMKILDASGTIEEGYSYADLAIIKLLRALRLKQLNLRSIVDALRHLWERFGPPNTVGWSNAHVYVMGKKVYAQKPDQWDTTLATKHGQKAMMRVLGELVEEEGALVIPRKYSDSVEIDPDVMEGQPVIRGTRIPTYMLVILEGDGNTIDDLANLYYPTPAKDIQEAIAFERSLDEAPQKAAA